MGTLTVFLVTGEHIEYKDDGDHAVGVAFGTGRREGWLQVLGHDLKKDLWETWAFYPPGGWVGVRGASGALQEAPKGIGFQGRAHSESSTVA